MVEEAEARPASLEAHGQKPGPLCLSSSPGGHLKLLLLYREQPAQEHMALTEDPAALGMLRSVLSVPLLHPKRDSSCCLRITITVGSGASGLAD